MKIFNGLKKIREILDAKSKLRFLFLMFLLVVKSILDGFGIGLIVPFIAAIGMPSVIFNNEIFQMMNVHIGIETDGQLLILMSITLFSYFLFKNLCIFFITYYQARLVFSQRSHYSRKLFQSYMNAPYSYHLEHNSAECDRNIRYEIPHTFSFIESLLQIFSNTFLVLVIFVILALANWHVVASMVPVILLFSVLILFFSGKYSNLLGLELQRAQLQLGKSLKEGLSAIVETKMDNIESFFPNLYYKHYLVTAKSQWRQITVNSLPPLFFETVAIGILSVTIVILSYNGVDILDILPIIGLFSFAFIRLLPAVIMIIRHLNSTKFLIPAVNVVHAEFQKFSSNEKLQDLNITANANKLTETYLKNFLSLKFEDVSFVFNENIKGKVLNSISFELNKGQVIAITGPSGSGKTTLLNIILGLLEPENGKIYVNDQIISNQSEWRAMRGYVPQNITLIDATIRENIALGFQPDEISDEKVYSVIKEAYLSELVDSLPQKLDTMIGENGMRLSGGQRQRLGLARVLYRDPKILVFDEATSSLDVESEKKITDEIMKFSGKRTMIIVSHRINTIKDCDIIYYLKNGQIVDSGNYSQLMKVSKDFRSLVNND